VLAVVPVAVVNTSFGLAPVAIGSTATAAMDALVLPFIVLATTLLYFDLQARKESDVELSAA
jgi:4-amino-4-deoxy-L-arabinose transferase-like glycosyltransferase